MIVLHLSALRFKIPVICSIACALIALSALAAGPEEVSTIAAAANRSSLETIHSYYADVQHTRKGKGIAEYTLSARYWRTPTTVRATEQTLPGVVTEVGVKDGKQHIFTLQNGKLPDAHDNTIGLTVGQRNRRAIDSDPWEAGLFVLPVGLTTKPPLAVYSLDEAARKGIVKESGWVKEGGRRLARLLIDCEGGARTYEVWVDPGVNWMIRKCIQTMRDKGAPAWRIEHRVDEFRELKPSIFVPILSSATLEFRGDKVMETKTEVSNVRVNEPLPLETPIPIPKSGVRAFDETAGTLYTIGKDGARVGPALPVKSDYIPAAGETRSEDPLAPTPTRFWLARGALIAAVVLLIVGLVLRRRRVTRTHNPA